jgi:hypothetical protein
LVCHPNRELRLKVFENKVLSRIFGPKIEDVTGGWRKYSKEALIV